MITETVITKGLVIPINQLMLMDIGKAITPPIKKLMLKVEPI